MPDLGGEWEITLRPKHTLHPSIAAIASGQYRLSKAGVFSGVYEFKDGLLAVVESGDPRLTEFVWKVQDANNLVLIRSSKKTGQDYTGSTLKRVQ